MHEPVRDRIKGVDYMIYPELKEILAEEGNEKDFEYKDWQCHIRRVGLEWSGHLCGYIEIPTTHGLHGKSYDEIEQHYDYELPAHGGLTFSGEVEGNYWIGFDCAHLGDLSPCYLDDDWSFRNYSDIYKDMQYVTNNIKEIIDFIEAH